MIVILTRSILYSHENAAKAPRAYIIICVLPMALTSTPLPYLKSITSIRPSLMMTASAVPNESGMKSEKSSFFSMNSSASLVLETASLYLSQTMDLYISVHSSISTPPYCLMPFSYSTSALRISSSYFPSFSALSRERSLYSHRAWAQEPSSAYTLPWSLTVSSSLADGVQFSHLWLLLGDNSACDSAAIIRRVLVPRFQFCRHSTATSS